MKETMITYIDEQEEICKKILEGYEKKYSKFQQLVKINNTKKWLVIATGSSLNAILSTKYYIEKISGISVKVVEPFTFINYEKLDESIDLVLAISQSGKSSSTIEGLSKASELYKGIPRISITSDLNSKITKYSDLLIDIGCGIEKVGFVTKGFTSTVLTLMLMGIVAARTLGEISIDEMEKEVEEFNTLINEISNIVKKSEDFYNRYSDELNNISRFSVIGYGPTFGVAKEAETKFTETVRVPTQGFELEAYMHGPYLEIDKEYGLFFIHSEDNHSMRSKKLRKYVSDYTKYCYEITTKLEEKDKLISIGIEMDEYKSPLLLVIVFQVLSYRISMGKGVDLDKKIFDDFDSVLKSKI
ncbi:SIS domain-containing protein [Clostridium sp. D2Q-14]|uniref:SIS domain-containing protein n=1 Tax=Anaeromonas gelatinilytica TaxID=2683194 RepID=UPI00193B723F|nr:SIS domain-containing protein [Anaeromonas gelatinilytica]MBS4535580.1 SIS domain-containing protein [Anaeromonas gelatinilytica]